MSRIVFILFFFTLTVFAYDSIEIYDKNIKMVKSGFYLSDKKMIQEDALKLFKDNKFNPFPKKAQSLSFYHGEVWYGFEVDSSSLTEPLFINFKDPMKERAVLYIYEESQLKKREKSGYLVPLKQRETKTFSISFEILSGTKAIYLIKTTSEHPHYNSFTLGSKEDIEPYWDLYHYTAIFISGIFIALILYNLFLYFIIKDSAYIYYIIYMSGLYFANMLIFGYLQVVLPSLTQLTPLFVALAIQIGIIGLVFFTENFLNMKKNSEKRLILINRILLVVVIISLFLIPLASGFQVIAIGSLQILFLLLLYIGYKSYKGGYKPALFYLLATGINLLCAIIFALMSEWKVISYNFFSFHISSIGLVWDMVVLSLALAYKVRIMEDRNIEQERLLIIHSRYENIGEITGNIAHQWRTPLGRLGAILTNLFIKSKFGTLEKTETESSLEQSNEIIQHLSHTIDTFQSFFITSAQNTTICLNQFVNNLLEFIKDSQEYGEIDIDLKIQEDIEVTTNENELSQIILSILINAKESLIKNNPHKPFIFIDIYQRKQNIYIAISDNGGGIKIDPIEKIFQPHITDKSNGTGLGLYIAQTLARKNDISLTVDNTNEGAVFLLKFNS